ncbi:unnamed protein product [Trichogramma brassicae]|uniref:Uncharacterized protein n=1 Tax=Trichogramma brassicae TaxID=86971 RepID=A0A6H5J569_9HYME|nr:unnamed protein product [Trichogramma brassicae]
MGAIFIPRMISRLVRQRRDEKFNFKVAPLNGNATVAAAAVAALPVAQAEGIAKRRIVLRKNSSASSTRWSLQALSGLKSASNDRLFSMYLCARARMIVIRLMNHECRSRLSRCQFLRSGKLVDIYTTIRAWTEKDREQRVQSNL